MPRTSYVSPLTTGNAPTLCSRRRSMISPSPVSGPTTITSGCMTLAMGVASSSRSISGVSKASRRLMSRRARSRSLSMPIRLPSATTGTCRISSSRMRSQASAIRACGVKVTGSGVMRSRALITLSFAVYRLSATLPNGPDPLRAREPRSTAPSPPHRIRLPRSETRDGDLDLPNQEMSDRRPIALLGLDRNGRAPGRGRLRQRHGQQPVLEGRRHPAAIHADRQPHATCEAAVRPLHPVVPLVPLFLLLPLLALDGEVLLLERDLDVLGVEARHFGLDHQRLLGLGDVHAGRPVAQRGELVQLQLAEGAEEAVELLLQIGHPGPRHHRSHGFLLPLTRQRGEALAGYREATEMPCTSPNQTRTCRPATARLWGG